MQLQSRTDVCVHVSYVYLGGLVEGTVGVDVVIKNDDSDHDPHAKQKCVLAAETTRIFPKYTDTEGGPGLEREQIIK